MAIEDVADWRFPVSSVMSASGLRAGRGNGVLSRVDEPVAGPSVLAVSVEATTSNS